MAAVPVAAGVTQVEAIPLSSLIAEQVEAPPQIESVAPLVVVHPTVAPSTGVTPSEASTRTVTGLVAWVPTGVGGFDPSSKTIRSVEAAPKVSTLVMMENAPLTGSLIVMVCAPSLCAGADVSIWLALVASRGTLTLPTVTASPGAKPVPCKVIAPPFTETRGGIDRVSVEHMSVVVVVGAAVAAQIGDADDEAVRNSRPARRDGSCRRSLN